MELSGGPRFTGGPTIVLSLGVRLAPEIWQKTISVHLESTTHVHYLVLRIPIRGITVMSSFYESQTFAILCKLAVRPHCNITLVAMLTFCLIIRKLDHEIFRKFVTATAVISLTC